jgi:hypothetical protein
MHAVSRRVFMLRIQGAAAAGLGLLCSCSFGGVVGGSAVLNPRPSDVLVMKEPRLSSNLEDNIGNPFAPTSYAAGTLHCMTVSLAEGGAGLGTAFGEQLARRMLSDAGFIDVTVQEAPGDPRSGVFVGTRPLA